MPRTLVWFSAGAASAVATKLVLNEGRDDVLVVYVNTYTEHADNERFIGECERWFDHDVIRRGSDKYRDTWDVWQKRRFILGEKGAPCTVELKKKLRYAIQEPDDVQVFGFTAEETDRAARFREQEPGIDLRTPLIERQLSKADCLGLIVKAGIDLPVMYQLGFNNNNCIGCPKGGMGYWNHIRRHFPDVFDRMSRLERDLEYATHKDEAGPVWLDELDPDRGDIHGEPDIDCSLLCAIVEPELVAASRQGDTP